MMTIVVQVKLLTLPLLVMVKILVKHIWLSKIVVGTPHFMPFSVLEIFVPNLMYNTARTSRKMRQYPGARL